MKIKLTRGPKGTSSKKFFAAEKKMQAAEKQGDKSGDYSKADRLHGLWSKASNPFDLQDRKKKRIAGRFIRKAK